MNRKKNSIRILAAGMEQFEAKQQQADFSTLETFLSAYLNTPGRKQRKQLAEEFQKRHLELHQFLKSHPETGSKQISNLLEKLEEGLS